MSDNEMTNQPEAEATETPPPSVRVHDYCRRYYGHDFAIKPHADPVTADVTGWGEGVRQGDILALPTGDEACLYKIESTRRPGDPGDMWFAICRFVPISSELGQRAADAVAKAASQSPTGHMRAKWAVLDV